VIIGRLIPAGTGFNTYEEVSATSNDDLDSMSSSVFEDGDDPLDVVLDDRTARAYSLESGLGEGFNFDRGSAILDEDDDLMIDDSVDDLEDEEDDDFDEDEDE
jgi:DNA-directed RNA polymerase subunit beta'